MKNPRILIVSPHADDETLGAGGSLLRFKQERSKIFWLNFTDKRVEYGYSKEEVQRRSSQIKEVIKAYSFDGFFNFGLKPADLQDINQREMIGKIADIFREIQPSMVILPFHNDVHSDHRYVFEATYSCTKIFRVPSIQEVLMMEIISETDFASSDSGFVPNYFVDISAFLDKKIKIMQKYREEIAEHPFPRSEEHIRALAIHRGAAAGCQYAESFILLKKIR